MEKVKPEMVYNERIRQLSKTLGELKNKKSLIAWARFITVIGIIAAIYYLRPFGLSYVLTASAALIAVFLRLVVLSVRNNEKIANLEFLIQVNQQELQVAKGEYYSLPDGSNLVPAVHDYAHDLDIFGRASIFQYINRTTSEQGHKTLSEWLLSPAPTSAIRDRQVAVRDLAQRVPWRQQLHAFGLASLVTLNTAERIGNWSKEADRFNSRSLQYSRFIFPALLMTALILMLIGLLPSPIFWGIFFIFFIIAGSFSRRVTPMYTQLDKIVKQAETISNSLDWIEKENFTSPLLLRMQAAYKGTDSRASQEVKNLRDILNRLDLRLNPLVYIFVNTFLFWDLQQAIALEHWKRRNSTRISTWFDMLGHFEALATLAALDFNHPDWTYPMLEDVHGNFSAIDLAHPLIPASKRIPSSFTTLGEAQLALITGSNMAGKSTFLRSVGVNIVLAMTGAPVCAASLTVSNMRVISSMRIADNLEENTSTFYAELKKLKYIIEAVNRHDAVFLLLDEILRGTNSLDRQVGSKALIRQLITEKAVGMLATHDLELAELIKSYPNNIHNYHFDVQVSNDDELYFDYKLKEGVCQSLNASILMRKIGIEM